VLESLVIAVIRGSCCVEDDEERRGWWINIAEGVFGAAGDGGRSKI
jgi:hypothetical protein